jgi:hypothetical protein
MTDSADLERSYSRLLAWYPAEFRRNHEAEMLGVLMDSARDGQRRVGLADAADLIRGALTVRLQIPSQAPRTVAAAVRLMCAGAAVSLAAWVSTVLTAGSVRSAMLRPVPARWHLMLVHLMVVEALVPVTVIGWLWMAWASGRGHNRARIALVAYFGAATLALLWMLGIGAPVYAPADMISLAVLWVVELSAVVLVFNSRSEQYYRPAEASGRYR